MIKLVQPTVLIAEDELALAHIVRESLEERGFKVILCPDGEVTLKKYREAKPDILVLDIMMPKKDGYSVAKKIREHDKLTPIIFLTARSRTKDVIEGFESGANDYLKKPFNVEELIVRIQVQLNREKMLPPKEATTGTAIQLGHFSFTPRKNLLEKGISIQQLTTRESDLLYLLLLNRQQVLEKDDILRKLWGANTFFNARSLDVFISKLRKYLSADPSVQIINLRGIGYKLVY